MAETSCPAFTADSEIRMGMNEQGCHMTTDTMQQLAGIAMPTNDGTAMDQARKVASLGQTVWLEMSLLDYGGDDPMKKALTRANLRSHIAEAAGRLAKLYAVANEYDPILDEEDEPEPRPAAMVPPVEAGTAASN
jgi:hypothetical protein